MRTSKKDFDCVQMMHEGGLRIHKELKDKTREEKIAYWRERDAAARREHPNLREREPSGQQHK
jgi:hypothetical protein